MWHKIKRYCSKEEIDVWLAKSKLPILLTTVKIRLWLILILFVLMIVLLFYAFGNQYPEYRQTNISYSKSKTLIFKNMYIDCNLCENNMTFYYELMNNFSDFKERNDSLIFNESRSIDDNYFPKILTKCDYFYRPNYAPDSIMIYGYINIDISNTADVKLDDSYNNYFNEQDNKCQDYSLHKVNVGNNKNIIFNRIERHYYKNKGFCSYFAPHRLKFFSKDLYSPNDNPYTLYQLSMPFYETHDFYYGSEDFKIAIHTNQGKTIALDVFPEPSSLTSNSIVYNGRKKFEEIMQNGGVYIYLQDIEKASKISRFQNYASLLAGALLAWIVELLVSIILVWKRLILPNN